MVALALIFFSVFCVTHCYALAVGESYGGGTVFCVSQTPDITQCVPVGSGDYGLVMANEDQANFDSNPKHGVTWSSKYSKTGALSDDNGAANTATVIAALPHDNPGNNAAWLCHNYRDQEGHDDWYLPSKNELKKMYLYAKANDLIGKGCSGSRAGGVQCLVGGWGKDSLIYWSSTESSGHSSIAWAQYFSNGVQLDYGKIYNDFGVRAVRVFNNLPIEQLNNLFLTGRQPIAEALVVMNDVDLLRYVAGHAKSDANTLLAVAQNPITDVAGLRAIVTHPAIDTALLAVVAEHQNVNEDLLLEIIHRSELLEQFRVLETRNAGVLAGDEERHNFQEQQNHPAFRAGRELPAQEQARLVRQQPVNNIPQAFLCSITLEVMREPVIDREGHTFERSEIENWLQEHNTCPISRHHLELADLAPNRALRDAIDEFFASNTQSVASISSTTDIDLEAEAAANATTQQQGQGVYDGWDAQLLWQLHKGKPY